MHWLIWSVLSCAGCTGVPEGLEPVAGFETDRYLGIWHEIARFDHAFERGLEDVSATYTRREDGGLRVRNRGYDPEQAEWREAIGRAYPIADPSVASLKVSFFGPFYGGYHVINLDRERYDAALVSGPTREYLWILARERSLDTERREALIASALAAGFDVDQLIWVAQTRNDPELLR
ncbi:MAG TPA: lipocalin family protein [Sumerlaeia bacterium]|nr:lipocalin family protein [Sumerlaeia bacterium]